MLKVIQAGMGGMGDVWLRTVLNEPAVEFAGFVEVNGDVAARQVATYGLDGAKVFPSLAAALAAVQADGLIDVTPPQFHRENSLTALAAGIPVLSEKPLANTRDDQVYTQLTGQAPVAAAPVVLERTEQAYLLHEFYTTITTGVRPATTCQDNIKSLNIVFDVVQSFEKGVLP